MKCKFCHNEIADNFLFCPFCGSQIARKRTKRNEGVKIPTPQKRGSKWRIRLQTEGVSATFDTKEECEVWAKAVRADFLKAKRNAPPKTKLFGEALDEYVKLNKNVFSPRTVSEYLRSKDAELSRFRDMNIYDITDRDMQQFVNDYAADHAPKTTIDLYSRVLAVIRSVNKKAEFDVNLPEKEKPNVTIPSDDDIKAIYDIIKGTKMEIPFLLSMTGSLRRGEIPALTKADLLPNGVHVWRDMVKSVEGWVLKKKPKTADSVRTALLPEFVLEKLRAVDGDRLCNMNPNTITSNWNRTLHRHGLPLIRFHDLRHYWVSKAHAEGIPDSYVMANGGWSTMDTPRKVYIKIMESENTEHMDKMNEILCSVLDQTLDHKK